MALLAEDDKPVKPLRVGAVFQPEFDVCARGHLGPQEVERCLHGMFELGAISVHKLQPCGLHADRHHWRVTRKEGK